MNNGWVKLHRAVLDNPMFARDKNAMYLFIIILLLVDKDTGTYSGGRFKLAAISGIKPMTCYGILKRLQKETMVKLKVNRDFTEITVVNWKLYQSREILSKSIVNARETQTNTKQEERRKKKEINQETDVPVPLKEIINLYSEHRAKLKAPLSDHAIKLTLNKLERLSPNDYQTQISIVEQSIERGWKGVFALSDKKEESKGWF